MDTAPLRRLLTPSCFVCGVVRGDPVCAGCLADYFPACVARCRGCANRLPPAGAAAEATGLCGRCLAQPYRFDATIALGDYAPPVDGMVAALKFRSRLDVGQALGRLMACRVLSWLGGGLPGAPADRARHPPAPIDAVVALPLAARRQRERGFNQSEELARALAAALDRPLLREGLVRERDCPAQQGLRLAQRRVNVRGAFRAARAIALDHVLLVDDVLTTGSTLDEAAACLKGAGVGIVTNVVVARTP
jgi:ComF family protein